MQGISVGLVPCVYVHTLRDSCLEAGVFPFVGVFLFCFLFSFSFCFRAVGRRGYAAKVVCFFLLEVLRLPPCD